MARTELDVLGVGNAIVDVLAHANEQFLRDNGLTKGAMTLIDGDRAEELHARMGDTLERSGGSAANTVAGIASLGGSAAYVGKVRDDRLGSFFAKDLRSCGVRFETPPAADGPPTARCLVMVTPDAQRTMQTFLGASATLTPDDVDPKLVRAARVTYLEGYLWDPPAAKEAFLAAARVAHGAGRKVALSLSDAFCVDRHREEFLDLVREHVDIVFANEEEVLSLFLTSDFETAAQTLGECCELAAVTRGPRGSMILTRNERIPVDAIRLGAVLDTTGAGDLYAAGFLAGWTRSRPLAECGRLGSLAAAEVIGHFGARPEVDLSRLAEEHGL